MRHSDQSRAIAVFRGGASGRLRHSEIMDQDDRKLRDKPDQHKAEEHRLGSPVSPWYHTILLHCAPPAALSNNNALAAASSPFDRDRTFASRACPKAFVAARRCVWTYCAQRSNDVNEHDGTSGWAFRFSHRPSRPFPSRSRWPVWAGRLRFGAD